MPDDLLVLVDPDLHDDVARCAAAAGYRTTVGRADDCRREWLTARAVVADPAAIAVLSLIRPPRRDGLILISSDEPRADTWRMAMDLGATDAAALPADENRLVRTLTEARVPRRRRAGVVAMIGAHGGAGASTLAAAVALTSVSRGSPTLLLDLDDVAPGADLLLGIEQRPGLRWQDLSLDGGVVGGTALHHALPRAESGLAVLTSERLPTRRPGTDAVAAVIDAGQTHGDLVVLDLPRADTPVVRTAIASADLVVMVSAPSVGGCAAARRVVGRLIGDEASVELVVRGPSPGGLRPAQVADAIGVPLIAAFRPDPRLPVRLEGGPLRVRPRSPLGRAARAVHTRVTGQGRAA
ncbi:septum site-determining protein Ssd [Gordonia westfalica]|uniref:Helicase/secretion neighborhood CpaE-like protein n=1 Tax=Gordonia westfalica TaxID=158898 RepID=A0A1H2KHU1_9ACTN|nr:septum site-determining protein Ssd [Gordonia westfalica]SDU68290.1 helicase/secretion neighborhood CpaE-like protein [Gordonia westfalica]